jgi:lysophospholipase L1-like esterase
MSTGFKLIVILGFIGAVLLLVVPLLVQKNNVKNYPSSGTGIIAFGDSLVEGVGSGVKGGFVTNLSGMVKQPIKNYGVSGDTTASALARITSVLAQNPNPEVVLVLLGGNDFLQKVPKEKTFQNLKMIIKTFQDTGAVVILLGVRGGLITDRTEEDYKNLSEEYNTAFVPNVLDGLFGNSAYMADTIHPNTAGYEIISKKVYPELSAVIK